LLIGQFNFPKMTSDEQLTEEEYQKKLNSRKKSRGFQLSPREFKEEEVSFVPEKLVPQIQVLPETPIVMSVPKTVSTDSEKKKKKVALMLIQPEKLSKKVKKKKLVKKIKSKVNLDELQKGISDLSFDDEEEEEYEYVYEEVEEEEETQVQSQVSNNETVLESTLSDQDYNELLLKRKNSKMKKLDLNGITEEKVLSQSPLGQETTPEPLETTPQPEVEQETPLQLKNPSIVKIQETKPRNLRNSQLTDEEYQELLQMRKHLKNKKIQEGIHVEKEEDTLSEEQYAEFLSKESQQQSITDNQYEELMRLRKGLKEKKVESRRKTLEIFFLNIP
jgi:hypothetical protein